MASFDNLDKTDSFSKLVEQYRKSGPFNFRSSLTAERVKTYSAPIACGLTYNWAAKAVDDEALVLLQALADEQQVIEKYRMILDGEVMNTGEKRLVLHHLLRACGSHLGKPVVHGGVDIGAFYAKELERFSAFAVSIHAQKKFDTVVQIGIGGSDLGPRAFTWPGELGGQDRRPQDAGALHLQRRSRRRSQVLSGLDPPGPCSSWCPRAARPRKPWPTSCS
jgi:glucose-6-phosphate isomerase